MKKVSVLILVFAMLALSAPVAADPGTLYVDDDGLCGGNSPCYTHPQDAVNAATPGDTILVHPGTYGERVYTSPKPPHWGPGDQYAPALIVWKDGLTIQAVDSDPANTVIQTTYNWWVNKALPGGGGGGSIEHSTGCTWNSVTRAWDGTCVRPMFGTAPNAVAIIASNVTIRGFTLRRPFDFKDGTYNTAGVMIGGLYAGYGGAGETLGFNNNTVENCVFEDVWHAVYIWHSSGNRIVHNTIKSLNTNHWAAISTYDGYNDAQIGLGNLSENNFIAYNTLANKGIALGAWAPSTWTSNAGSKVCCNTTTSVGVTYAHGPVVVGCNSGGFWQYNTDNVIWIKGIAYTGAGAFPVGTDINLIAQLDYDGSADGSGVEVIFRVNGAEYPVTTVTGGSASVTVSPLPVGVYEVQAEVTVCDDCVFTDKQLFAVYDPTAGFVTGGGWIESPVNEAYPYMQVGGKANFGFVAKYKKGASVPDGNTQFVFKAGNLNFQSTSYQWLVVNQNDGRAQFKGYGTINGEGNYGFMLWATDGDPDTFRIKIWDAQDETVVYDNGTEQALGGGSIVVHK